MVGGRKLSKLSKMSSHSQTSVDRCPCARANAFLHEQDPEQTSLISLAISPARYGAISFLSGNADHLRQRIALAVVGLSAIERQIAFKVERGWKNLPFYADVNGNFSRDYHAIMDVGIDTAAENDAARRDHPALLGR